MSTRQEDLLARIQNRRQLLERVRERRTALAKSSGRPDDEEKFRAWYSDVSRRLDLDPDPDNPRHFYDYREAFRAGATAELSPEDGLPHWPSEFKRLGHPNLIVDGRDTRTGEPATPELARESRRARMMVEAPDDLRRAAEGLPASTTAVADPDLERVERTTRMLERGERLSHELGLPVTRGVAGPAEREAERRRDLMERAGSMPADATASARSRTPEPEPRRRDPAELLAQADVIQAPAQPRGAEIRSLPDGGVPIRTTADLAASIEEELDREQREGVTAALERMRSRVREPGAPPPSIGPESQRARTERTAAEVLREEAEAQAERIRRALPPGVTLAARAGRGVAHSPLIGQFLVRPALDLYNEHVRDGRMSADDFLALVEATGPDRAAEIIGTLAGYGVEISTTGRLLNAAGHRLPGNPGAFLRDFDPHRAVTRARAAVTGAIEGIPSDVAAAVEHGDPKQVPLGMALGAAAGPLFRRTASREELLERIARRRRAMEAEQAPAPPTREDAPGASSTPEPIEEPIVPSNPPPAPTGAASEAQAAALEVGARRPTPEGPAREAEDFVTRGIERRVRESAFEGPDRRVGERRAPGEPAGGELEAARVQVAREEFAKKPEDVQRLQRAAAAPDEAPSPLAVEHVRVSEALPETGAFTATGEKGALGKVPSPVKTIEEMREALAKLMGGMKVGEGRMRSSRGAGTKLGEFKAVAQVIRQASASDVRAFSHEMGHALQKLLLQGGEGGLTNKPFAGLGDQIKRQLKDLARGISDESLAEGWAEYWRRFIDNPDALRSVPELDRWVQERLDAVPQLRGALEQMRERWALYRAGGPEARIEAHIARGDDPRNLSIRDTWSRFRTNVLDTFEPLRQVVEHVRARGIDVHVEEDAEQLARLVAGAPGQAEHALEFGPLNYNTGARALNAAGEPVKPLREIVDAIEKNGSLEQFERYALSRRTLEAKGRNISTGIRPEDAADFVPRVDELYREAFQDLQDYQDAMLRYLVDAGVLSEQSYSVMKALNQDYVPLYRALGERGGFLGGSGQFGHLFSPVKRLKGSGRDIIPPLESIVRNTFLYTELAAKQRVSQALSRLAAKEGVGEWLEGLLKPIVPQKFKLGEIERDLGDIVPGIDELLKDLREAAQEEFEAVTKGMSKREIADAGLAPYDPAEELLAVFRPGDLVGRPNTISVLRGGKRQFFEVDPDLYRALEGLDREQIGWIGKLGALPASTLRAGATLTPEFSIRNVMRDQVMAFIQSEYGYTPFVDMARGMFEILNEGEVYQKWLASGGQRASLLGLDRKAMQEKVRDLAKSGGVPNVIKNPLDALRALSAVMEDATRMGEFINARKVHGTSKEGLQRAAVASREISIDFARHGAKTTFLRHVSAFWNARMQGYDRLARAFQRDPGGATIRAFSAITVPSILEYVAYRDDPEYWEIPQWQRDLFWVARLGDTWVRIPKPFELGLVFGTLPQRIMASLDAQDPQGLTRFVQRTLPGELEGMLPIPTVFSPIVENFANYSMFLDRPIVPRSLEDVSPEYQSSRSTSEAARLLGRWTGTSPMKIDNLLYAWTGGLGRTASEAVDVAVGTLRGEPARPSPTAADVPIVRALTVRNDGFGGESVERFYDLYSRAQTADADVRLKEREHDLDELNRLMADPETTRLLAELPRLRRAAGALAQLRAEREIIYRDTGMTAEEKRERIDELGQDYLRIARDALGRELPGSR